MAKWIGDRISVEDQNEVTTIVIHPIRTKWKEVLLTIWVVGFTFVGLAMFYLLVNGFQGLNYPTPPTEEELDQQLIYGIVFMGFWAYFEYKTVKSLLWYRFGKELVRIDDQAVFIKKSILSYGKADRYFFENIKKFGERKTEDTSFSAFFENAYWALGTESLMFDYHGKTKSFGRRLDDQSIKSLIRLIDDRIKKRMRRKKKATHQ